jgi:hypothetical protein
MENPHLSNHLKDHGLHAPHQALPPQLFTRSQGHTQLLKALEQLPQKVNAQGLKSIGILSDGVLDTRHLSSIKSVLVDLKKKGWRIYMIPFSGQDLSPHWQSMKDERLIEITWPQLTKTPKGDLSSAPYTDPQHGISWGPSYTHLASSALIPILHGPKGGLLYRDSRFISPTYFATAEPNNKDQLIGFLKAQGNHSPTIQLDHLPYSNSHSITIHIKNANLEPLRIMDSTVRSIPPIHKGVFSFKLPQKHRMSFYHPETGSFQIQNLQSWFNYCQRTSQNPSTKNHPQPLNWISQHMESLALFTLLLLFIASLNIKLHWRHSHSSQIENN